MKIEVKILGSNIILLVFNSRRDVSSTLLRFQEYYESPEFKNKFFSLKEFKTWYIKNSKDGKRNKKFTYYEDWGGFNIPGESFKPFLLGRFDPLTAKEKRILEIVRGVNNPFYVIGVFGDGNVVKKHFIDHELKHALFYTNAEYKKEVLAVLSGHNFSEVEKKLGNKGYNKSVFIDEIHAYATDSSQSLRLLMDKKMREQLESIFLRYEKGLSGLENF
ncbi:MAG: hypothetical protein WCJ59_00610 [bacterium]